MKRSDYATLEAAKRYAEISGTSSDTLIGELIPAVSREIDRMTRRFFYEMTETRRYDFQDAMKLRLDHDLLSITTLTNGDGDTLTENTHFYSYPLNGPPYRWLEIRTDVGNVFQWSGTAQRAISIAGEWGYNEDYANAWLDGDTVQDVGGINATTTSVTVADASVFGTRQTIKIEDEQMLITARDEDTEILTVTRGINGSTAASHSNGDTVYTWDVHPPIERACKQWVTFLVNTAKDLGVSRERMGDYEVALNFFILDRIREGPPGDVALVVETHKARNYWR